MKKFGVIVVLLLALFVAPAAGAQGNTRIGDHVCFGGSTVVAATETPKNVVLFGCGARIQSGARVSADVVSFGGDVVIEKSARVERNVVVFGGNLNVAGDIGRDIASFGGRVSLDSTAVVAGNVAAFGSAVEQSDGAILRGRVTRGGTTFQGLRLSPSSFGFGLFEPGDLASLAWFGFARGILSALTLAALGALTIVFFPTQTRIVGETAEKSALASLGAGCVTFLAAPTLILFLVVLICTIPFAVILGFAFALAIAFGWIAIGRIVGERILAAAKAKEILPIVAVILGVFLLAVVGAVPIVGWLISLAVAMLGIGAVVLTRFGTRAYPAIPVMPAAPAEPTASVT
ncbi:MAG: polymer-forming cytoskeletal protein [Chloroflexi bacterium]|nr:polymer-forming cytoskeletal protein [Chloroflexota bacterium]